MRVIIRGKPKVEIMGGVLEFGDLGTEEPEFFSKTLKRLRIGQ